MTKEEFKAKVSMALGSMERETWEEFLESIWQLHLEASNQWIPVDRELPEKEEDNPSLSVNVIVTDGNSVFESYYSFNLHIWAGTDIYGTITHWMPLPAPPKEE